MAWRWASSPPDTVAYEETGCELNHRRLIIVLVQQLLHRGAVQESHMWSLGFLWRLVAALIAGLSPSTATSTPPGRMRRNWLTPAWICRLGTALRCLWAEPASLDEVKLYLDAAEHAVPAAARLHRHIAVVIHPCVLKSDIRLAP